MKTKEESLRHKEAQKKYRRKPEVQIKEKGYKKKWRMKNKNYIKNYNKKYREKYPDYMKNYWKNRIEKSKEQAKQEIINKAKEFNGMIKTIEDLFSHLNRVQKCSICKKDYYDKLCPDCIEI